MYGVPFLGKSENLLFLASTILAFFGVVQMEIWYDIWEPSWKIFLLCELHCIPIFGDLVWHKTLMSNFRAFKKLWILKDQLCFYMVYIELNRPTWRYCLFLDNVQPWEAFIWPYLVHHPWWSLIFLGLILKSHALLQRFLVLCWFHTCYFSPWKDAPIPFPRLA